MAARATRFGLRTGVLSLVLLLAATFLPAGSSAAAATLETYPLPAGGGFTVDGLGSGHGHGLSQWGAQGAAMLGHSADTITAAYYPGTSRKLLPAAPIRIWLTGQSAQELQVYPANGLRWAAGPTDLGLLPAGPGRWRVTRAPDGVRERLSGWSGSAWVPFGADHVDPLRLLGPALVRVGYPGGSSRGYRGSVAAVPWTGGALRTVVSLPLEDYLLSVVPSEAYASWLPAALQSQAIAARSYSGYLRAHAAAGAAYDLCDSPSCQLFRGTTTWGPDGAPTQVEQPSTSAAVRATAAVVRSSSAASALPIFAEFSSSNGGWEADGGRSYLPARQDDWDGVSAGSSHSWTGSLSAADLVRRWPAVGRLVALTVTSRDGHGRWGGRVLTVQLHGRTPDGSPTTVTTTGDAVRSAGGLWSSWWRPRQPPADQLTYAAYAAGAGVDELARRLPDGSVAERTWTTSGGLGAERSLGGAIQGTPAVVSRPSGGLDVFGRNAAGHLVTAHRAGISWSPWRDLGGSPAGRPAVIRGGPDELHVFAVFGDGLLHHAWSVTPGTWSAWESLGGAALAGSGPAAVSLSPGSYDVVTVGADRAAWHRSYRTGWGGWTSLGGVLTGDVSAGSAAGELSIVGRGVDGAAYVQTLLGAASSGWRSLGGVLMSNPAAAGLAGSGRLDVFGVGSTGALYRTTRTAVGWSGWRLA